MSNNTPLSEIFLSTEARILDLILCNHNSDYSLQEITLTTGVPYNLVQTTIANLIKQGIIIELEKSGTHHYTYKANHDSDRTAGLLQYINATQYETLKKTMVSDKK